MVQETFNKEVLTTLSMILARQDTLAEILIDLKSQGDPELVKALVDAYEKSVQLKAVNHLQTIHEFFLKS